MELVRQGVNDCEIGRRLNIPRGTIKDWRSGKVRVGPNGSTPIHNDCPRCDRAPLDPEAYAYLLGMYLGDGLISKHPRAYRLRIVLDVKYPDIINSCMDAMAMVRGGGAPPALVGKVGCVEVGAYWRHWPCVFPQHGPGRKHLRPIVLAEWQGTIIHAHPKALLRGLVHSDGCRDRNVVNGKSYPRYSFANNSEDIQRIFCAAADILGVRWTRPYWNTVAISRRPDVEYLDTFIGPKS